MVASAAADRIANSNSPGGNVTVTDAPAARSNPVVAVTPAGPRSAALALVFLRMSVEPLTVSASATFNAMADVETVTRAAVIATAQTPVTWQNADGR